MFKFKLQKRPVLLEQLAVPHAHGLEFTELPLVTLQLERFNPKEQVFLDKLQKRPVLLEQLAVPHVHGLEFAELP